MIRRFLCWLGAHKWSMPGGECEDCGYPDTLFDHPKVRLNRLQVWEDSKNG